MRQRPDAESWPAQRSEQLGIWSRSSGRVTCWWRAGRGRSCRRRAGRPTSSTPRHRRLRLVSSSWPPLPMRAMSCPSHKRLLLPSRPQLLASQIESMGEGRSLTPWEGRKEGGALGSLGFLSLRRRCSSCSSPPPPPRFPCGWGVGRCDAKQSTATDGRSVGRSGQFQCQSTGTRHLPPPATIIKLPLGYRHPAAVTAEQWPPYDERTTPGTTSAGNRITAA